MRALNKSTYIDDDPRGRERVETVVGDEKQSKFLPRIKIKRWNNEANFSIGLSDTLDGGAVSNDDGVIKHKKGEVTAQFYALAKPDLVPLHSIRRVNNGGKETLLESTAEYELINHICTPGTMYLSHYYLSEPSLVTFDRMTASMHLDVDDKSMAKDFNYPDKSAYQPADVPMPTFDRIKLGRLNTPYTPVVNPLYADEGLALIDAQWPGTKQSAVTPVLMQAIENVLKVQGIEVVKHDVRYKLYFKHGERWVKFFSSQEDRDWFYAYVNFNTAYNKAYDFYKPDITKDIRDQYAYGLKSAYPDLDMAKTMADIMTEFSNLINVPMEDMPYSVTETTQWKTIQGLQDNHDWTVNAKRSDASWIKRSKMDGYEFDIVLDSKPANNYIRLTGSQPKSAVAYHQAEISFDDQIARGVRRDPQVAGSLAVYHVDKMNNQYQTGKLAHIYRPIAYDSTGRSVLCSFNELNGLADGAEYDLSKGLTIVVPQEFLDSATYPVTVDPPFGYSTAGTSFSALSDTISASVVASPSTGQLLSSIAMYIDSTNDALATFGAALYTRPSGTLSTNRWMVSTVGATASNTVGWSYQRVTDTRFHAPSTNYVLAVWGQDTTPYSQAPTIAYDSGFGALTGYITMSLAYTGNWPATLSGGTAATGIKFSIYANTGYQYPIMVGNSAFPSAVAQSFNAINVANDRAWGSNAVGEDVIAPVPFDLTNFKVDLSTAPGAGNTRTFSAYLNDAGTALAASAADTATTASDGGVALYVASGDTLALASDIGGTPANTANNSWRVTQTSTGQVLFANSGNTTVATGTWYLGIDDQAVDTTRAAADQVMPETGTLDKLYAKITNNTISSGSYVITLVKNGSDTTQTVTLNSTTQSAQDLAHPVSVAATDTVCYKIVATPSTARSLGMGIEYTSGSDGNGLLLSSNDVAASNSAVVYNNWHGSGAWKTTSAPVQALAAKMSIVKLYVSLSAAPGAGKSRTVTLVVNGTNTLATVQISGASATNGTWTGRVIVNDDDTIYVSQNPAGTPAAATVKYSFVFNSSMRDAGSQGTALSMMRVG